MFLRIIFLYIILVTGFAFSQKGDSILIKSKFYKTLLNLNEKEKLEKLYLASFAFRDSFIQEGIVLTRLGIDLSKKFANKEYLGEMLANLSFMYVLDYNYKNSMNCIVEALKIANELNNDKIHSAVYNVLGLYYYKRGVNEKAFDYYLRAIRLREKLGFKKELAASYNNLGIVLMQLKDYNQALDYLYKSLKIKNNLRDYRSAARTYSNIVSCYKETGEFDKAFEVIDTAISVCNIHNNIWSKSLLYMIAGDIYLKKKDYKKAFLKYTTSLKLNNNIINRKGSGAVEMCLSLSDYYREISKYDYSINYLDTALFIAIRSQLGAFVPRIYMSKSETYEKMLDFKQANEYRKLFINSKDSLDNSEKSKIISELQVLYNIEEKDKEIQEKKTQLLITYFVIGLFILLIFLMIWLIRQKKRANLILEQKNEEIFSQKEILTEMNLALMENEEKIKKYSEELKEMVVTRDRFFSIIAHDLRSPFNVILGLSDLLRSEIHNFDQKKIIQMADQLYNTADIQFNFLENLLEWGRLQIGKIDFNPKLIDLENRLNNNINILSGVATAKEISFKLLLEKPLSIFADINMFDSIIRNVLSNAIKFSNRGDEVVIKAVEEDSSVKISITDNGIGIPDENLAKLFRIDKTISTTGTNKEKGTGLGLILCKELIEKHKGRIEVTKNTLSGVIVSLTFPQRPN